MWSSIAKATLAAGTLDITAACVNAWLRSGTNPDTVLRFIASGVFGPEAFSGGWLMPLSGLIFHFIIAASCAVGFYLLYPLIKVLHNRWWLNAFLIALTAWIVPRQIVIPLSQISPRPFSLVPFFIDVAILFFCVGLPITYFARRHFGNSGKI